MKIQVDFVYFDAFILRRWCSEHILEFSEISLLKIEFLFLATNWKTLD